MLSFCSLITPFFDTLQQILNLAWTPLTFFGSPVPSISETLGSILGCTV